jgi:hypothetical protein
MSRNSAVHVAPDQPPPSSSGRLLATCHGGADGRGGSTVALLDRINRFEANTLRGFAAVTDGANTSDWHSVCSLNVTFLRR